MAEEMRLWRYTAGKGAQDWVAAASYILTVESVLPRLAQMFDIVVSGPASDAETAANPKRIEYRPGYPRRELRKFVGSKDAEYQQLAAQGKGEEAEARADALIEAAGRLKVRG